MKRNLSALPGMVDHEPRYGQARGGPLKVGDDLDPLAQRCSEMLRTGHRITLVQVVGPDADLQESLAEGLHRVGLIVHTPQQDGLVVDRYAASEEPFAGLGRFRCDLLRVIELGDEPQGSVPFQYPAETACDALRQSDRHPASDADDLHVSDPAYPREHRVQLPI